MREISIYKQGEQRLVDDGMSIKMFPIADTVDKNIIFRREKFMNDLSEIVEKGEYTQTQLRDAFHCSLGKISALLNKEEFVQVPVEALWFVCAFGHEFWEYFD